MLCQLCADTLELQYYSVPFFQWYSCVMEIHLHIISTIYVMKTFYLFIYLFIALSPSPPSLSLSLSQVLYLEVHSLQLFEIVVGYFTLVG